MAIDADIDIDGEARKLMADGLPTLEYAVKAPWTVFDLGVRGFSVRRLRRFVFCRMTAQGLQVGDCFIGWSDLSGAEIRMDGPFDFFNVIPSRTAAELAGVNRHSATLYYQKIRAMITREIEDEAPFDGEIEVDESYSGGHRKGKRGRGAGGKIPVFGLLKRGGKVYAKIIPDASGKTLMPIIAQRIQPDSVIYSDCWKAYNAIDVTKFRHHRINHSELFAEGRNHINGIENFWNQAKRSLSRYNGIPAKQFNFFLQECVFRFNYGSVDEQRAALKKWKKRHLI